MRKIEINQTEVRDILTAIGAEMDVQLSEEWGEYNIQIPEKWGRGEMTGFQGDSGFGLYVLDCEFDDEVRLDFINRDIYPLSFSYCLEGNFYTGLQYKDEGEKVEQHQCIVRVNGKDEGYYVELPANVRFKSWTIEIDQSKLEERLQLDNHPVPSHFSRLFQKKQKEDSFIINHMYSLRLSDLFDQLANVKKEGFLKIFQIQSLMWQILGEHLSLYEEEHNNDGVHQRLRAYEIQRIREAAFFIEGHLDDSPTIPDLAWKVGINPGKLQDGFKLLYDSTINEYVQKVRMQKAQILLDLSDHTISEISDKIGISSKSYFSKVFKEQYGLNPSEYRKKKHARQK